MAVLYILKTVVKLRKSTILEKGCYLSAEEVVLAINLSIISFAYFWLFPKVTDKSVQKLMSYDSVAVVVAVGIVGTIFYGSGTIFNLFSLELDWFSFSIVSYFVLEVPFALWYFIKHDIWKKL